MEEIKKNNNAKIYIANAFSLSMIPSECVISIKELKLSDVKQILSNGFISIIGHQATADVLSKMIGIKIELNRVAIKLEKGDKLIVFQLTKRLGEGQILNESELNEIIENKMYKFYLVEVI